MNPRHLWDANLIEEGNHQVIWELLFDIWNFYKDNLKRKHQKIRKKLIKIIKMIQNLLIKEKSICKLTQNTKKTVSN